MQRTVITVALLLTAAPAMAQQQVSTDRIAVQITGLVAELDRMAVAEASNAIQLQGQLSNAQTQISSLQKQITDLKAKYEPEKKDEPKP